MTTAGPPPAVLLAGVPRSGSTWIAEVLTAASDVTLVHEPDNHALNLAAFDAKRGMSAFPLLQAGTTHQGLAAIWSAAAVGGFDRTRANLRVQRGVTRQLSGGLRTAWLDQGVGPWWLRALAGSWPQPVGPDGVSDHIVVKTVHACRMLDWLVGQDLGRVVTVRRDGADIVSSWSRLGWRGQPWAADVLRAAGCVDLVGDTFAELAATAIHLVEAVETATSRLGLVMIDYSRASVDPHTVIRAAADRLGLPWDGANDRAITQRERVGTGYVTNRARGGGLHVARSRLTAEQQRTLGRVRDALQDPTR